MKTVFYSIIILVSLITLSCSSDKKIDSKAVREEIKSREIIKITDAELLVKVHEIGKEIALNAKKILGKNLKRSIKNVGVINAIEFCNINAMPLTDSLKSDLGVDIKRVTLKARNPKDIPNELEKELLEAYAYQWNDSMQLQSNVQEIDDNRYLYTLPILIDSPLCLNCHGAKNNGLLKETNDYIKTIYPEDQATDYQLGDLRGMWSITIPKKKVVQTFYQ